MNDRVKYYQQREDHFMAADRAIRHKVKKIGQTRMIIFLMIILSIAASTFLSTYFLLAVLGFIVLFALQVKRHARAFNEGAVIERMLALNISERAFLDGDKSEFDGGDDIKAPYHIYAEDLDIFGHSSLFQAVNRTGTHEGRQLVRDTLLNLLQDVPEIERRRSAIAELEPDIDWRQRLGVIGKMSGETPGDMPALRRWVNQDDFFSNRSSWIWIARLASGVSVAVIAWMFIVQQFYPLYFFGLIIINSTVRGFFDKPLKQYFSTFGSRTKLFQKFADLFELVAKREFSSDLGRLHAEKVARASVAFAELSHLSNRADQRLNGLVGPVMNGLFLFDIWNVHAIERWRIRYRANVDGWIMALANIDMLNSLANYKFNNPGFKNAVVTAGAPFIKAKEMGHPLIPFDQSVKNDYELGVTTKAHIVTGSNMAGKSTFIRTVGLNLVLALNGLPVCAKEFSCSVVSIASCIRITDSLEEHASYFRAELKRLELIVGLLGKGESYIVLLDEILRGTNSDDKRMGTLAFFKKLKDYNCLAILATHDLVLGKLEEQFPQHYSNYCFESELRGSQLYFDYKLRRGVSSSTNATYLMKSLGLID